MRSAAALSGNRLPYAWHSVLHGQRRGLWTDPRHDEVVLGALFERRVGECTSTRPPAACPGPVWITPRPRDHCRIRPATRRRRILCREPEDRRRTHRTDSL